MHFICFKDGKKLKPNDRINLLVEEDQVLHLHFEQVYSFDSGDYTIVLVNEAGQTEHSFTLTSEGKVSFLNEEIIINNVPFDEPDERNVPLFSEIPENVEVNFKDKFDIEFTIYSTDKPKVKVVHNEKFLGNNEKYDLEFVEEKNGFYRYIFHCRRADENDDGTYEIVASNMDGQNSMPFKVLFKEKIEKPTLTKKFGPTKLTEGNQLLLEVTAKGYPTPVFEWFKDDEKLLPSHNLLIRQQDKDGILAVNNVIKDVHDGIYKCVAKNDYGKAINQEKIEVLKKQPKFLEKLTDLEVCENQKALLAVKITTVEDDVTWAKDGEELDSDDDEDYHFIKDGQYRKLLIQQAKVQHQGEYTCSLEQDKCTAYLEVVELPAEIIKDIKDCNIKYGDKAHFTVEVSKGDAVLQWFKNKVPVEFDDRIYLEIDGKQQTLVIKDAKMEDVAEYSCSLNDQVSKAKLVVQHPSTEFLKRLEDEYWIDENCETVLTVEISRPDVDVYWYHNGEEIRETSNVKIVRDDKIRKLVIHHTKMSDGGEYICMAKGDQTETTVNVSKEPLVFILKLKDFNVNEGETATLSVEVLDENYQVVWMKDDKILEPNDKMTQSSMGKHKKLIIKNVNTSDRGFYTAICKGQRSTAKLSVLTPPKVLNETRRFYAVRGENFPLDIFYEGHPAPKCEWFHSGKALKTSKKTSVEIMMSRTILTIKNFDEDDVGLYKLILENSIGQYITHFELMIIDKPDPPSEPEAKEITNNSLILIWQEPKNDNGSPVTNYIVEYKEAKARNWKEYSEFITERNVKIKNLKHNVQYVFRVYAINKGGKSDPSPESEPILMEEKDLEEEPTFIQKLPPTLKVQPDVTTKLECKAIGNPTPKIEWFKDDELIEENEDIILKYDQNSSTLIIKKCSFEWSGEYKCVATNKHGQATTMTELLVQEKPYAKFNNECLLSKVKQGVEHSIDCEVFGFPEPEIKWLKGVGQLLSLIHI